MKHVTWIALTILMLLTSPQGANAGEANTPHKNVVLYGENVAKVRTNTRFGPTDRIWRIVGTSAPELLAEVGEGDEHPIAYLVSPDKRYLVINLGRKLKVLDLNTRKMLDLFESEGAIAGFSYSPDRKRLFIWSLSKDRDWDPYHYYAHMLTIANRKAELLLEGDGRFDFVIGTWRSDGKILLKLPEGEVYVPYYFDLISKSLGKTPVNNYPEAVSNSGMIMAVSTHFVEDACVEMDGHSPDSYDIIDPISGVRLDTVSSNGIPVLIDGFSEDDKDVLYETERVASNAKECNAGKGANYFRMKIGTHRPERMVQPDERLVKRKSRLLESRAEVRPDRQRHVNSLLIDNKVVVTSKNWLYLIEADKLSYR